MTRTWWENESILTRFREWLVQTGRESAAWSPKDDDPEPEGDAFGEELADGDHAGEDHAGEDHAGEDHAGEDLAGEDLAGEDLAGEDLAGEDLAGEDLAGEDLAGDDPAGEDPFGEDGGDPSDWPAEPLPEVGLLQLLESFTALRHELKLQTKSARGLDEMVRSALQGLEDASRQFKSVQAREREVADRAVRPYVESLIAWHEAVGRGIQSFATTHRQATAAGTRRLSETLEERFAQLPKWRQWFARGWHEQVRGLCAESFARLSDEDLQGVNQGFALIQSRLDRSLKEHEIRRIECAGRRVDPTEMTVVELVDDPRASPETVVDEVRPGYAWRGQVLRFAEVRATRGTP